MERIKLSLYWKRNKEYFLRNAFISFVQENKDINQIINNNINYIKDNLITYLECDLNLNMFWLDLEVYIKENLLNYKEIKKVFNNDRKNTTSPKLKLKEHINSFINNNYYLNCILNA